MFDFQKLIVYKKSQEFNKIIAELLRDKSIDKIHRDQLRRAAFSIPLNIAEGSSRFSKPDRKHFYTISRGSTYECVAIMDYLEANNLIGIETLKIYSELLEEISKMLYSLITKLGDAKLKY